MFSSVSLNMVCFNSLYVLAVASLKSYLLNPHLSPLSQLLLPAVLFLSVGHTFLFLTYFAKN